MISQGYCHRCGNMRENSTSGLCHLCIQDQLKPFRNAVGPLSNPIDDILNRIKEKHLETPTVKIQDILEERGKDYGSYEVQGGFSRRLKDFFSLAPGYKNLSDCQQDALDMIATKISRILNGNPDKIDSWKDISGFAELIVQILERKKA